MDSAIKNQLFFWRECGLPSAKLIWFLKNTPLKYRNDNSVRLGSQVIDLSVRCSFTVYYFSVSRLFPLPRASIVQTWKGKGFRAEYSPQEEDSARNGLPLDLFAFRRVCTNLMDGNGNKRLTIKVYYFLKKSYICILIWLYEVLDFIDLSALTSFTADILTIISYVKKEVSMVAMLITGAVGFV